MKISFFQYTPKFNDLKFNIDNIKNLIVKNEKKIKETKILVFPEYFISGSLNLNVVEEYNKQFLEVDVISEFEKISLSLKDVVIVFGSIIHKTESVYKNSTLVYKNGQQIAIYSKKALIYNENYLCKSDDQYPIIEIDGKKIGIAICWDLILPEVFRKYTNKVDLVILPSFWGIGGNALQAKYKFSLEKKYYRELCIARAYENSFGILFVNSVGKYTSPFYSDRMMGGSLLVTPPLGETYFTNSKKPDYLHVTEIDFSMIDQYREFYATDKDYEYYKTKNLF